jgi:hypothetical protein
MSYTAHPYQWQNASTSRMTNAVTQEHNALSARGNSTTDIAKQDARAQDAAASSGRALENWTTTNETVRQCSMRRSPRIPSRHPRRRQQASLLSLYWHFQNTPRPPPLTAHHMVGGR